VSETPTGGAAAAAVANVAVLVRVVEILRRAAKKVRGAILMEQGGSERAE